MAEAPEFSGSELRDNIIFDPSRELKGEAGHRFLDYVGYEIAKTEKREKSLRPADANNRRRTLSAFLANLAVAAFSAVKADRFVSVSFGKDRYASDGEYSELSYKSATVVRDFLSNRGWTEGRSGFNRFDYLEERFGMLTRIRATPALVGQFADFSIEWQAIRAPKRETIRITKEWPSAGPEPASVTASRAILERINVQLADADIEPPPEYWSRIAERQAFATTQDDSPQWPFEGDLTATTLYRSFSRNWEQGGRLYGSWWLSEPADIRAGITIDGATVCELDYRQLHPSLLYARLGTAPPDDIYTLEGFDRELNKETFMRLLNGRTTRPKNPADKPFPKGKSFPEYVETYLQKLSPISKWLGEGEGLKLQKEDSDLAISILDDLHRKEIIALPVHDSFIVKHRDRNELYRVMKERFVARYGVEPEIRG